MLFGGVPADAPAEARASDPAPINVPAPGVQAPKAVTQAPPWTEASADLATTIPKAPLPKLPPMRAKADSIEEITGSVLLAEDSSADVTQRKPKIEDLSDSHVLPADASGPVAEMKQPFPLSASAAGVPATMPAGPPVLGAPAPDAFRDAAADQEVVPYVPIAPPSASRRIVHDLSELWAEPQRRWILALMAGGALIVLLGTIGLIRAIAGSGSASAAKAPVISTVSGSPASTKAVAAPPTASEAASTAPQAAASKLAARSIAACVSGSVAHVVSPRAQIRVGVETAPGPGKIGLGFAMTEKEGMVVTIDPTSITAAAGSSRVRSKDAIKRVVPVWSGKGAVAVIDSDRKGEFATGARSSSDGAFLVGAADGKLAWAVRSNDAPHPLWPLEADEPVEALRIVPIPDARNEARDETGYALAFRQGASIFVGTMNADKTPNGTLTRVAGLGPQIGSPAIAAASGSVVVVWADRAATSDPWMLRMLRFVPGQPVGAPRPFVIPPGGLGEQAMSPGITSVSGDRFLLAWTEGPVSSHQVRAETLSASADPLGAPITVSGEGINAGQGQPAVLPDGRGLVVYLASPTGAAGQVVATPVSCPLSSP